MRIAAFYFDTFLGNIWAWYNNNKEVSLTQLSLSINEITFSFLHIGCINCLPIFLRNIPLYNALVFETICLKQARQHTRYPKFGLLGPRNWTVNDSKSNNDKIGCRLTANSDSDDNINSDYNPISIKCQFWSIYLFLSFIWPFLIELID